MQGLFRVVSAAVFVGTWALLCLAGIYFPSCLKRVTNEQVISCFRFSSYIEAPESVLHYGGHRAAR